MSWVIWRVGLTSCKTVRSWLYLNFWNPEAHVKVLTKMKLFGSSFSPEKGEEDLRALSSMDLQVEGSEFLTFSVLV